MEDLYEILEVHHKASSEVIKKAYQALARKHHPDLVTPDKRPWAEEKMQAINSAYAILSDRAKRAQYDEDRVALQGAPQPSKPERESGRAAPYIPSVSTRRSAGPGDSCIYHAGRRPSRTCPSCHRLICAECCRAVGGTFLCPDCAQVSEFNTHFADGENYLGLGRNYEAVKCFQEAIRFDPNSGQAHYNLGLAYLNMGSNPEAIEALTTAANLMTMVPEVHIALAKAFKAQGRFQAAIQEFQRTLQLSPESHETAFELGCLLHKMGSHREAFPYIERALQRDPSNAQGHFIFGKIYLSLGKKAEAHQELDAALRLDSRLELRLNEFPFAFRAKHSVRRLFGGGR